MGDYDEDGEREKILKMAKKQEIICEHEDGGKDDEYEQDDETDEDADKA